MGHRVASGGSMAGNHVTGFFVVFAVFGTWLVFSLASRGLADEKHDRNQSDGDDGINGVCHPYPETPFPIVHHAGVVDQVGDDRPQRQRAESGRESNQSDQQFRMFDYPSVPREPLTNRPCVTCASSRGEVRTRPVRADGSSSRHARPGRPDSASGRPHAACGSRRSQQVHLIR